MANAAIVGGLIGAGSGMESIDQNLDKSAVLAPKIEEEKKTSEESQPG